MLTGKQRSYLRGLAQELEPTAFIGKSGITDQIRMEIDRILTAREMVKVKLQDGCDLDVKDAANLLAGQLSAEYVQSIGHKFTLYRKSKDHPVIQIPLAKSRK